MSVIEVYVSKIPGLDRGVQSTVCVNIICNFYFPNIVQALPFPKYSIEYFLSRTIVFLPILLVVGYIYSAGVFTQVCGVRMQLDCAYLLYCTKFSRSYGYVASVQVVLVYRWSFCTSGPSVQVVL